MSLLCVHACLGVSIPGHGGSELTGGLTLLNPLLGVPRMMMWAVDTPWWFHFLRASSRSQIEKLWGYYKVRGWLTLNMMTIPCWHFHFLKRPIPSGSQMCFLFFFVQITFTLLFRTNKCLKYVVWPASRFYIHIDWKARENFHRYDFPRQTHAWNQTVPITHKCLFSAFFFVPFILSFKRLQRCSHAANQWE